MIQLPPPTVATAEDLLAEFEQTGDTTPFEEIVRRYSGMVYGVCYRVTRNAHDAEDATQATFLKLATHARTGFASSRSTTGDLAGASGRAFPRVGPWLQQVAKTTAVDLRRSKTRRQNREQIRAAIEDQRQPTTDATDDASMDELKQVLRDEVDRLPVHYRTPLILYYFGGLSTEQIAVELKTNAKALAVRLFRARKMLGTRLTARGVATAGGSLACLAVADSILAALAGKVWQTAGASGIYGGMYATAGGGSWLTSHSAVVSTIAVRINATLRASAIGLVASKWKMSIAMLLTVGTTMAGTSEVVQQAPVVRDVARWLQDVGQTLREMGNLGRMLQDSTPKLRAENQPTPTPTPQVVQAPMPIKPLVIEPNPGVANYQSPVGKSTVVSVPPMKQGAPAGPATPAPMVLPDALPALAGNRPAADHRSTEVSQSLPSASVALLAMSDDNKSRGRRSVLPTEVASTEASATGPVDTAGIASTGPNFQSLFARSTHSNVGPYGTDGSAGATETPAFGPVAMTPATPGEETIGIGGDPTGTSTGEASPLTGPDFVASKDGVLDGLLPDDSFGGPATLTDPAPAFNPGTPPPASQPIPEPGAMTLLALGAAGLLARRRRRSASHR